MLNKLKLKIAREAVKLHFEGLEINNAIELAKELYGYKEEGKMVFYQVLKNGQPVSENIFESYIKAADLVDKLMVDNDQMYVKFEIKRLEVVLNGK